MSDATKRTCGCDWSLWETCDECNPDDEAAEIRRLRTRLAESEGEVGRLTRESEGRFVAATMKAEALLKLEAERNIARQDEEAWRAACQVAEAEVGRLRDALEAVTECEEHRPCGLCRDRVRRAVEAKP